MSIEQLKLVSQFFFLFFFSFISQLRFPHVPGSILHMPFLVVQSPCQVLIEDNQFSAKKRPNKWVFNFDLDVVSDSDCLILAGSA